MIAFNVKADRMGFAGPLTGGPGIQAARQFDDAGLGAARLDDRPSSQNVAALTLATQVALIGAPAVLGFVAQHFGIRAVFILLVPFVAAALWFARFLVTSRHAASSAKVT